MPRNSQSPPLAVERTSSLSVGWAPDVAADGRRALDDVVAQGAEALDLDLDDITRVDGAGDRRRTGQQHVTGLQGDRARDVRDEVVHVPLHLAGVAVLTHLPVDDGADLLVVEVPALDQPGPERAQGVCALHPQHRAGVGVAEVVQPVVVADRVAADVVTGLMGRDVARGPADHDGDLALVVQPLAARRTYDGALVGVQRRYRLVEVRRGRRQRRHHLLDPREVVEVDAHDLRRDHRCQVGRVGDRDLAAVAGHQCLAVAYDVDDVAVEQDAAGLSGAHLVPRGQPAAGRSGPEVCRT